MNTTLNTPIKVDGVEILPFSSTISPPSVGLEEYLNAPNFIGTISPNDHMFWHSRDANKYHWVGRSAIESIKAILKLANRKTIKSILDFGCGHGRVCRAIRAEFPSSKITVCDLKRDAVDFCKKEFDATPIYSSDQIRDISLPGEFDLIWVGSVFSHLNRESWFMLLDLFHSSLVADGILIASVEGPFSFRQLQKGNPGGLTFSGVEKIKKDYEQEVFGYAPYKNGVSPIPTIGRTFVTHAWTQKAMQKVGFRCFAIVERGYGGLQDVFGCLRITTT